MTDIIDELRKRHEALQISWDFDGPQVDLTTVFSRAIDEIERLRGKCRELQASADKNELVAQLALNMAKNKLDALNDKVAAYMARPDVKG